MQDDLIDRWSQDRMEAMHDAQTNGGVIFDEDGTVIENPHEYDLSAYLRPQPRKRPYQRHDTQRCSSEFMQFGVGDLVLRGDFKGCTSKVENSFGIGLRPNSEDAETFLAGRDVFDCDAVEIWAVGQPAFGDGF